MTFQAHAIRTRRSAIILIFMDFITDTGQILTHYSVKGRPYGAKPASQLNGRRPPPWEHLLHPGLGKALINQHQYATVLVTSDNPARRLDHLAHPRVEIGVIEPRTKLPPKALLELLVDRVDLRQPECCDKRADQARAR